MSQIEHYPYYEESLQDQAKRASKDLDLDPGRVNAFVNRLTKDEDDETPSNDFYRKMELAVFYVGPARALELYEKGDMKKIFRRQSFIEFILDSRFPMYSANHIIEQIESFLSYLERNKSHIIKTGFPQYDFKGAPFFNPEIAYLYFVKIPIKIEKSVQENGDIEFNYTWGKRSANTSNLQFSSKQKISPLGRGYTRKDDGKVYTARGEPLNSSNYEEADLMDGLSLEGFIGFCQRIFRSHSPLAPNHTFF